MDRATFNFLQLLRLLQQSEGVELEVLSPTEAAGTKLLPGYPEDQGYFCTVLTPEGGVRHCRTPACVLRLVPTPSELVLSIDGFATAKLSLLTEEDLP